MLITSDPQNQGGALSPSDWIPAVIALLSLVAAVVIGVRSLKASERAAEAAELSATTANGSLRLAATQLETSATAQSESLRLGQAQLESSIRAHVDSLQPYLWVDLRARDDGSGMMVLVLGNSGPTVATDVHVEFQPPLSHLVPPNHVADANHVEERFRQGISSIAPGRVITWALGLAWEFFTDAAFDSAPATAIEIKIVATGPHGPIAPLTYSIALEDLKHQELRPVGLGLVEAPLKKLEKDLAEIVKVLKQPQR